MKKLSHLLKGVTPEELHDATSDRERFDASDRWINPKEWNGKRIIHSTHKKNLDSILKNGILTKSGRARKGTVHEGDQEALFVSAISNLKDAWKYEEKDYVFLEVDKKGARALNWYEDGVEGFPAIYTFKSIYPEWIKQVKN